MECSRAATLLHYKAPPQLEFSCKLLNKLDNGMSKKTKLIEKFFRVPTPTDFRWDDLVILMKHFGFTFDSSGGGSHGHFVMDCDPDKVVDTFKPHPNGILNTYQIREIKAKLKEWGICK